MSQRRRRRTRGTIVRRLIEGEKLLASGRGCQMVLKRLKGVA
jgi:hypothetical protein